MSTLSRWIHGVAALTSTVEGRLVLRTQGFRRCAARLACATMVALIGWATPVVAAIVDHGAYVTDTNNNADWLKFSATLGMSFNQAVAANPGWAVASIEQVHLLWTEYGYVGDTELGVNGNAGLTDRVAADLGYTFNFSTPAEIHRGISSIVSTSTLGGNLRDIAILQVRKPISGTGPLYNDSAASNIQSFLFTSNFSDPNNGVYMTRLTLSSPVPESETYVLLLAGLALVAMLSRRSSPAI